MIKRLGKSYYRLKGFYPVKIRDKKFRGDPFHIYFWRIMNRGGFEPNYFKILDQYLSEDSIYCDIGSWIGPTVLYATTLCKNIYAIEPDPEAFKYLNRNLELNSIKNVSTFNFAVSTENGIVKMASHGGNLGDSMTSMINIDQCHDSIDVPSLTWNTWLKQNAIGKIDFIKIDIEGGEVEVVPDMIDYLKSEKPVLHISTHGPYLNNKLKKDQLDNLFSGLQFYNKCYDDSMQAVKVDSSLTEDCLNNFKSFLFVS